MAVVRVGVFDILIHPPNTNWRSNSRIAEWNCVGSCSEENELLLRGVLKVAECKERGTRDWNEATVGTGLTAKSMTARSARSDPQASKNNKQRQTPNKIECEYSEHQRRGLGVWNSCEWGWRECVEQNKWTAVSEHLLERKRAGKWTVYARATVGSLLHPCRNVFAEQNGTTDEHRFTCVGVCVGKSKCGTVWNAAQRNEITGYSCCVVLEVGECKEWGTNECNEPTGSTWVRVGLFR